MSSPSIPFYQNISGMVGEARLLQDRLSLEHNLPQESLVVGSTPEMDFVKQTVLDTCLQAANVEERLEEVERVEQRRV
jgi:hypothetical protein